MIDEGANDRRQAAAYCENEVNDSVLGIPLREDMDQAPLRQLALAGMFRQERHPEPGNRRVAKGEESTQVKRGSWRTVRCAPSGLENAQVISPI